MVPHKAHQLNWYDDCHTAVLRYKRASMASAISHHLVHGLRDGRLILVTDHALAEGYLLHGEWHAKHVDHRAKLPAVSARGERQFAAGDGMVLHLRVKNSHDSHFWAPVRGSIHIKIVGHRRIWRKGYGTEKIVLVATDL